MAFIVYQDTTGVIYGTGETLRDAWRDAREWIDGASEAGLRSTLADSALVTAVRERGGDVRWYHDAGRVAHLSPV